jgi:SAM-dependent methyltransferase
MTSNLRFILALLFAAGSGLAFAQAQSSKPAAPAFEPSSGQAGKDVIWVPTPQVLVDRMLDMAKVTAKDYVMDLGSGDGRTVITAARRGARAVGIEYNPEMVEYARRAAEKEGVADKATFMKADLFETDFSNATVITMFLLPSINLKLRPKLLGLKPGTRIVSNSFTMDTWEADEISELKADAGCNAAWCTALLWIVPARVEGTHALSIGELVLKQQFQMLSGSLTAGGVTLAVKGRVRGEDVIFSAGGNTYRARMKGKSLALI